LTLVIGINCQKCDAWSHCLNCSPPKARVHYQYQRVKRGNDLLQTPWYQRVHNKVSEPLFLDK